jgi:hypothetical protein
MGGGWMLTEQLLNGSNHIYCFASPSDTNGQTSTTEFIDHIEEFQSAAIHRLVELEVDRPHVMRIFGSQRLP